MGICVYSIINPDIILIILKYPLESISYKPSFIIS